MNNRAGGCSEKVDAWPIVVRVNDCARPIELRPCRSSAASSVNPEAKGDHPWAMSIIARPLSRAKSVSLLLCHLFLALEYDYTFKSNQASQNNVFGSIQSAGLRCTRLDTVLVRGNHRAGPKATEHLHVTWSFYEGFVKKWGR